MIIIVEIHIIFFCIRANQYIVIANVEYVGS